MKKRLLLVAFAGAWATILSAQNISNLNLEDWTDYGNYEEPTGDEWATANPVVNLLPGIIPVTTTKTTDAHGGQFAAKMESKNWPGANILLTGTLATGEFDQNALSPAEALLRGTPYTARPDRFKGWYKYTSVSGDSAHIYAWLTKWNPANMARDTVGIAFLKEYQTVTDWTEFDLAFDYHMPDSPDSISIVFASSAGGENLAGQVGSTLFIDDIEMETATGLVEVWTPEVSATVYPNPSSDMVHLQLKSATKGLYLRVFDLQGKQVHAGPFEQASISLEVSDWPAGSYHYLLSKGETNLGSGKFVVQND